MKVEAPSGYGLDNRFDHAKSKFEDFAAIKLVVESSGAVKNLTILEAIDFTKATTKASKIGYKAPGQ